MKNTKLYLTEWQGTQVLNHVRETLWFNDTRGFKGLLNRIIKSVDKGYITTEQLSKYMIQFFPLINEGRNEQEKVLIHLEKLRFDPNYKS